MRGVSHARGMFAVAAVVAGGINIAFPGTADACGGFFCSSSPVDQEAERIIFAQETDNRIATYVEIRYQGEPGNFAWVVPAPAVPTLDTWNGAAFDALDVATQPIYNPPWACFRGGFSEDSAGAAPSAEDGDGPADPTVIVHSRERIGPFDTAVIESEDPNALVIWLRDNGYRIVEEMEPFIALYTAEGMKFVALKLAPGEGIDSISPIKMTYAGKVPQIPLRLTSIAAVPEMGVKVWVLGEERYGPKNTPDVEVDDSEIVFDNWSYQHNYVPLVARKVDEHGGRGFVTEYAQATGDLAEQARNSGVNGEDQVAAQTALVTLLESQPYITRLYSRLSPEEMDHDPMFHRVGGDTMSNIHDLSLLYPDQQCDNPPVPEACDFAACGGSGLCAGVAEVVEADQGGLGMAGCACAPGSVARAVPDQSSPNGMRVSCIDERLNFLGADAATTDNANNPDTVFTSACGLFNPCGDKGECVDINGTATCRCGIGYVAAPTRNAEGMVFPTCANPLLPIPMAFYIETIPVEPNLPYPGRMTPIAQEDEQGRIIGPSGGSTGNGDADGGFCTIGGVAPTTSLLAMVLLGVPFLRRRRAS